MGNVAAMLAMRLTTDQQGKLGLQRRYEMTPMGLYDAQEGRLVNDDKSLQRIAVELETLTPPLLAGVS